MIAINSKKINLDELIDLLYQNHFLEYYEGADEFPVKTVTLKVEEKALVVVSEEKPPAYCDYRNMAVIPGFKLFLNDKKLQIIAQYSFFIVIILTLF